MFSNQKKLIGGNLSNMRQISSNNFWSLKVNHPQMVDSNIFYDQMKSKLVSEK